MKDSSPLLNLLRPVCAWQLSTCRSIPRRFPNTLLLNQPQLIVLYCLKLKLGGGHLPGAERLAGGDAAPPAHRLEAVAALHLPEPTALLGEAPADQVKHRECKSYDKAANARMDEKLYHRRSLVETVISVLKRQYGDAVSSRVWWRQFRELVAVCLVYNVERAVKLGVTLLDRLCSWLLCFLHWRISTEPDCSI